jgi:hypothetical protein
LLFMEFADYVAQLSDGALAMVISDGKLAASIDGSPGYLSARHRLEILEKEYLRRTQNRQMPQPEGTPAFCTDLERH